MFSILLEISLANYGPAFQRPMALRARYRIRLANGSQGGPANQVLPLRGSERVHIETGAASHPSRLRPSVSEGQPNRIVGLARLHPYRAADCPASRLDLDYVRIFDAQVGRGFAANQHDI